MVLEPLGALVALVVLEPVATLVVLVVLGALQAREVLWREAAVECRQMGIWNDGDQTFYNDMRLQCPILT